MGKQLYWEVFATSNRNPGAVTLHVHLLEKGAGSMGYVKQLQTNTADAEYRPGNATYVLQVLFRLTENSGYEVHDVKTLESGMNLLRKNPRLPSIIPDEVQTWDESTSSHIFKLVGNHDLWACTRNMTCEAYSERGTMQPFWVDVDFEELAGTRAEAMQQTYASGDIVPLLAYDYFQGE